MVCDFKLSNSFLYHRFFYYLFTIFGVGKFLLMKKKSAILFFLFLALNSITYSQCSQCKQLAESSGAAGGINNGIMYIMFVPYLLLGGFVFFVFRKKIFSFWKELTGKGEKKEYNIENWY